MLERRWLDPALIRLDLVTEGLDGALQAFAEAVERRSGVQAGRIEVALQARVRQGGIAIGRGVAIPHATVPGLGSMRVGLARLRQPLESQSADGQPVDLLFFVLAPPGTVREHLLAIAHVARLCQDDQALARLRTSDDVNEVLELLATPPGGHDAVPEADTEAESEPAPEVEARVLVLIEMEGEAAVDQLLLDLASLDLDDALLVEGKNLRDALSRDLPLFSSFRELFGDPGGRRLVVLTVPQGQADRLLAHVKRLCEAEQPRLARVLTLPVLQQWRFTPPPPRGKGGH